MNEQTIATCTNHQGYESVMVAGSDTVMSLKECYMLQVGFHNSEQSLGNQGQSSLINNYLEGRGVENG